MPKNPRILTPSLEKSRFMQVSDSQAEEVARVGSIFPHLFPARITENDRPCRESRRAGESPHLRKMIVLHER